MLRRPRVWKVVLSHTCTVDQTGLSSVNENSSEGNDSELSDKTGGPKSDVSYAHVRLKVFKQNVI